MSVTCGVECVFVLGCTRWLWKRCTYISPYNNATWPSATTDEFELVPRLCCLILAIYEPNLATTNLSATTTSTQTGSSNVSPTRTHDHDHREIVLAVRGLNLAKESYYKLLLDSRLGMQMFDGGYVHHGLLKSAKPLLTAPSRSGHLEKHKDAALSVLLKQKPRDSGNDGDDEVDNG